MHLLIRPENGVLTECPGFEFLKLLSLRLSPGEHFQADSEDCELGIVLLGGRCSIESSCGSWTKIGRRPNVFAGMPYALYLPIRTRFTLTADSACDIAICYSKADRHYDPRLVTPSDVAVEIRGAGNATRQINSIFPPTFPAQRLIVVEVYTPAGNWSSYPPHKHDVHNPPGEVDLEEIYYYRIDKPEGYAIQKVYTADKHLDETMTVHDGELVLVPEGYHPVVAAHGYNVYYLNALAGSARSLAASEDPQHRWVRHNWREKDARVPVVSMQMEE